jgi:glucose-1-phosphate thymidylyltransferase
VKGLICAGGAATRLEELTRVTNKHLLPVGRWPMV